MDKKIPARVWLSVLALFVVSACDSAPPPAAPETAGLPAAKISPDASDTVDAYVIEPTRMLEASEALRVAGAKLYTANCVACHGAGGRGDGEASYLLYPKPRDFTAGVFRYKSTWAGMPTDTDLYRTVSRGMPGSAMPSWAHLPENDRWALVHYVKSLAAKPVVAPAGQSATATAGAEGAGPIAVPPEPPDDVASRKRGAELFAATCSVCHGERGQADGPQVVWLRDAAGYPIRPRDLTTGVFKGAPRPDLLYARIVGGIADTPMPEFRHLIGDDAWHVVHYVLSLSSPRLRDRAEMRRFTITAPRIRQLPDHPDAGAWAGVPSVELHLMPLWWRYNRPEYVTVQAVHDGKELALMLEWSDDTHDEMAVRPQDFRDAAAIEFSLSKDPPFFAMGEAARFVNIWMWKSERQADLAGFHDIDTQYPNIGIDSYPNLQKSPYEQPMRDAATLDSDPTFITGWGAGNIVSDPTRRSAAEDLAAQGFATLRSRPGADQAVQAAGVYGVGSYRVMFRRPLNAKGNRAVDLRPGQAVPVAFAIWDGSAGDRDGKKSVTIWQNLILSD